MEDKMLPEGKKSEASGDVLPSQQPSPDPLPIAPQPIPKSNGNEGKEQNKRTLSDLTMVIATCLMAVAAIFSAIGVFLQWQVMSSSGVQTDKIIAAAKKIVEDQDQLVKDNKETLDENRKNLAEVLRENREEIASALKQNRLALTEQTRATHGQLIAIQKQTELGVRPWIAVTDVAVTAPITIDISGRATTTFHAVAQNIGKTPAKEISISIELGQLGGDYPELKRLCTSTVPASDWLGKYGQVLFPGQTLWNRDNWTTSTRLKPFSIVSGKNPAEWTLAEKETSNLSQDELIYTIPQSVIGCVRYKSSTSDAAYYTGFQYLIYPKLHTLDTSPMLVRFDRRTGDATTLPNSINKGHGSISLPSEWIGLTPNSGWGNDLIK